MYGNILEIGTTKSGAAIQIAPPKIENINLLVSWLNDPEVMQLLNPTWQPTTVEKEMAQLTYFESAVDTIMWNIEVDASCVGAVWINEITQDRQGGYLSIMLGDKAYWGQGIATQVFQEVTNWALSEGGFSELHVDIFQGNEASKRMCEKAGYTLTSDQIEWDGKLYEGWTGIVLK